MADFRKQTNFETRCNESRRIREKYPDRIPIIVTRALQSKDVPDITRRKFLVPNDLQISQFMYVLRKRIKLAPEKSLYLFIGEKNVMAAGAQVISTCDLQHKHEDGFLYITYAGENTFG